MNEEQTAAEEQVVEEKDSEAAPEAAAEAAGTPVSAAAEAVASDLDELTAAKRERDEYLDLAQRTKADFDNYRKRVAKEAGDALARGRAELASELVPVLDNLERAVESAAGDSVSKGVALVLEELRSVLERAGVEAYDPAGEKFDPAWHEALSTKPSEGTEPGTVIETLERGYRLNGQVLRPARGEHLVDERRAADHMRTALLDEIIEGDDHRITESRQAFHVEHDDLLERRATPAHFERLIELLVVLDEQDPRAAVIDEVLDLTRGIRRVDA